MALSNGAELKLSIQEWLDRSDYAAIAEDVIVLAEGHFNLELRHRKMITKATLTPVGGSVALPNDFLAVSRVVATGSPNSILSPIGAPESVLDTSVGGLPCYYSLEGDELLTFPQSNVDITLHYYQEISHLTDGGSNWLLLKYPNIYQTTCMMEAHRYFQNTSELQITATRVNNMIERLNEASTFEELSDTERLLG